MNKLPRTQLGNRVIKFLNDFKRDREFEAKAFRSARLNCGLSQSQCGELFGVCKSTIGRMENSLKSTPLRLDTLKARMFILLASDYSPLRANERILKELSKYVDEADALIYSKKDE